MSPRLSVVPVAVVALLSACSSSSSSSPTTSVATSTTAVTASVVAASSVAPTSVVVTTPGATTTSTTTAGSTASTSGDPGCDVSEAVEDALASDDVQDVSVDAQCTSVDISTSLAASKGKTAVALCNAAAPTAYAGAISAVNVEGADGNILASGTKSNGVVVPCATNG